MRISLNQKQMRTKHLLFVSIIILLLYNCKSEEPTQLKSVGKIAFYSNAQEMLENDTITVDVFVDNIFVGKLRKASYIKYKTIYYPSDSILITEQTEGKHFIYAKTSSSDTIMWADTINVIKDSVIGKFLDGWKYASSMKKIIGTWVEKNPEFYDGISDTISFERNMTIGKHYLLNGRNYIIENNNLLISNSTTTKTYKYLFSKGLEIYFHDFPQRSSLSILRPVYFTKIRQL